MTDREQMVQVLRKTYGFDSPRILQVMLRVPREKFVLRQYRDEAYQDGPVSIGFGQTMSQPYTVAFMTNLLGLQGNEKVLEIGTGSGYQAAILSKLAKEIYTIEIVKELAKKAQETLQKLKYRNIQVKDGSGEWGWKEHAPYDAIIITAGVEQMVPRILFDQLKVEGVLVAPVGEGNDKVMTRFTKLRDKGTEKLKKEEFGIFHFVPFLKEKAN